jgi:MerR family transcriptional regulator, mercuric resistance operon regulatory protein
VIRTRPSPRLTLDSGLECILNRMGHEENNNTIRIGRAARQVGLSIDTIRFYERRSLLPRVPRTAGRFRLYSTDDIARLTFIRQMQGLGFSLQEIRQLLDLRGLDTQNCREVRDILRLKLDQVRGKVDELKKLERTLIVDLRKCDRELKERRARTPKACPVLRGADGKARKQLPCS